MKELLKQVKQYKKDSVLAPVYSALEVVMEVIIPFVMALLIDEGVEKGNMNKILLYGIIMIVLAMICTPKVRHIWRCIFLWAKQEEKTKRTRQNSKSML